MNLRGLLVLGALASAYAFVPGTQVLVELDNKPMGNALLSTVHLQLETGAPVDEIVSLLDSIKTDLLQQQDDADLLNQNRKVYCSVYDSLYSINIEEAKQAITLNEDILARDRPALASTKDLISKTEAELQAYNDEKVRAAEQREEEHEAWVNHDAEYEDSIAATYEAIDLVRELKYNVGSTELVQIRFSEIQTRISKSMNKYHNNLYGPSVTALAELATSADQGTVAKIIELLEALADDLTVASHQDADSEDQAQANWEQYDSDLADTISNTEAYLVSLNDQKASLELSISTAEEDLASAQDKKAANEKLLADLTAQCENWTNTYLRETSER